MSYIKSRKRTTAPTFTKTGLSTALIASMVSTAAFAAPQTNDIDLPEVSVSGSTLADKSYHRDALSGTKFTQPVSKTPKTIHVIDQGILQDQHATTLTEALKNSPGVGTFYVGENGNTATGDAVYMRGFDSSNSIFVDGVRDMGAISRDTFNTNQVEVIKGPDGVDYGRTAPSGSINMVSKRAKLGNDIGGTISAGTDDQKRATFDVNRQIGDNTAWRVNVMGQDSGVPGRDEVTHQRWGIAPSVSFGLGTDTRLTLNYLHITQNNVPDGGASTIGLPGYTAPKAGTANPDPQFNQAPPPNSSHFYGTKADYENATVDMVTLLFEQNFGDDKTFHSTTRWGRTHQDYLLSAFMASDSTSWDMSDLSAWTMRRLVNALDQTNAIVTNQSGIVQWVKTGAIEHNLSYGLELTRETIENTGVEARGTINDINIYHPSQQGDYYMGRTGADGEGTTDTAALYLFDTMTLGEHWQFNAGMRLDHYKAKYQADVLCGSRGAPACDASLPAPVPVPSVDTHISDNLFTWQLGTLYQINEQGNIYVSYAVSQQPPGGSTLKLSASSNSVDNPMFDPQEAKTTELGTKWKLADGHLLLAAAVYRTDINNQVESDGGNPAEYYQNGKKRVEGIELSAVGQITPDWNISAGFTTLHTSIVDGAAQTQDGSDVLSYNPSKAFTSWTTYRLPFGLVVGGGARYNGEMKRGRDGAVGTPAYVKSYWVADAMASYAINKHVDVQLNIYNITDKDYVAAINKSGYRYTPGTPRSALLAVNYRF